MDQVTRDSSALDEAERRFGFDTGQSRPLADDPTRVYEARRDGRRFILKIARAGFRPPEYVLGELEFINYLASRGVPASRAVPSASGSLVEALDGGSLIAYAYQKAEGSLVDWRQWTPALFRKWGALVGRMHALAKDFRPSSPRYRRREWDGEDNYDFERDIPPSEAALHRKAHETMDWLRGLPKDRDSYGLIHEDLHQWNFFVHEGELVPFDFDNCKYDWFVGDFAAILHNAVLAQTYYYQRGEYGYWAGGQKMDSPTFTGYFLSHFMEGYNGENRLDPAWLRRLPNFFRRRHISTYVTGLEDVRRLGEAEARRRLLEFPFRSIEQHAREVESDQWVDEIFETFLKGL